MLSESLKTKILKFLNDKTNARGWEVIYPEIHSTEAMVYKISSPNYPSAVALKLFNKKHSFKTEKQYSAFKRFSFNMTDEKYRIPQVYGMFPEDNCFLMEWISGDSLRNILWKNCLKKARLQTHIKSSYQWLNCYHENANQKLSLVDNSRYIRDIQFNSESIDVEEFSNNTFEEGFITLKKYSDSFLDYQTVHAQIHGDLSLKNIIINDDYVAGIDIGANYYAPIADDVSQMLSYICINYFNMLTQLDMRKSPDFWEIFNVIFDAYQYPKIQKERDFFLFVFLYQMLNRWISVHKFHNSNSTHSFKMDMLGKWRLYNSRTIVRGLTKAINMKLT